MLVDGLPGVYPYRGLGFDPDLCAAGKRLVWRIHNAGQAVYFCRICVMVFPAAFNSNGRVRFAILFISPNDVLIYMDALFSAFICHLRLTPNLPQLSYGYRVLSFEHNLTVQRFPSFPCCPEFA